MSKREFIALGTASQVPTRKRNHNGYFLRWDEHGFLFDPGEGTQRQMIFAGVSAKEITKIFITHFHGDHCLGLPGVLQRLSLDKVSHPIEVYFPASGKRYFENLKDASIYYNTATIKPMLIDSDGVLYADDKIKVSTMKLDHTVESWGFRIEEADSYSVDKSKINELGITGPLVGELKTNGSVQLDNKTIRLTDVSTIKKGQTFAFIMDTRKCDAAVKLADKTDVLVIESTFLDEHQDEANSHGHLTATDAATIAQEAGSGLLVLTHFSQRYGEDADFVGQAGKLFKNVIAVKDGDRIDVRKQKFSR